MFTLPHTMRWRRATWPFSHTSSSNCGRLTRKKKGADVSMRLSRQRCRLSSMDSMRSSTGLFRDFRVVSDSLPSTSIWWVVW